MPWLKVLQCFPYLSALFLNTQSFCLINTSLQKEEAEEWGVVGGEENEVGNWWSSQPCKSKFLLETESSWSAAQAWEKRGGKEKEDLLLKQNWNSDEKKDCPLHAQMSMTDLNWVCRISHFFVHIKKNTGEVTGVFKEAGGKATEVPWSYKALNSYIPFIAWAGMTSPLISKLSNPAACVRTVWGTKWNIYMPL